MTDENLMATDSTNVEGKVWESCKMLHDVTCLECKVYNVDFRDMAANQEVDHGKSLQLGADLVLVASP